MAGKYLAPEKSISRSSFFEDILFHSLEQMVELFGMLYLIATAGQLPKEHAELGDLTIVDGSLIDAVLSIRQ